MKIKKDLLAEINKKANKIKEKRADAANNKTIEAAVFDFFKNIEDSKSISQNGYDEFLFSSARESLIYRLKNFDRDIKISVEFNKTSAEEQFDLKKAQVRGVTLWWSQHYIATHNVDPSLYIDIGQMLLFLS